MSRLVVERVHRLSSRPWAFVSGRLEGEALRVGDELSVSVGDVVSGQVVVESVELHSAGATTTIAVDGAAAESVREGSVLSRP
ncbi:hypothetical protein [Actinoplanes couchii]|uniref:Uncharacterized protein n=1 Tax=Actinoplanes couchii TaxID=403638 RepID=A0ABQ3WZX0_9ACTN|nr:hypothetical protein [Actinoplanes couchii]MDR6316218.1 GTPase [Actinoplanes couchii]GID51832.1 hypothetical protein Aco03nite_002360 [Actinoplanes couchii]